MEEKNLVEAVAKNTEQATLEIILDFINRILEALAWPFVVLAVAFIFKNELKNVASNLKRLKWGDAEAVFNEGVAEAKAVAKTLDPVENKTAIENDQQTYTLLQQAEVSPTGAVIEAYKSVEEKLASIARIAWTDIAVMSPEYPKRSNDPTKMPPSLVARTLHKAGWLSHAELVMLERLRETRNLAAHSRDSGISQDSAKDFVRLAGVLEDALQSKINKYSSKD